MRVLALALMAVVLLLCGCVYTLHPFITPDTAVFDPALVGTWSMPDSAESWDFAAAEGMTGYTFTYTDKNGAQGVFQAQLTDIDGTRFIQFAPDLNAADECGFAGMNDFYRMHFVPMSTFAIVRSVEPALALSFPDFQWFEDYLEAHPDSVQFETEQVLVLTDTPEAIRAFLGSVASEDSAFSDSDLLFRNSVIPELTEEMIQ